MERHPIQLHLTSAHDVIGEVCPVENGDGKRSLFCKPIGGLWTSTWDAKKRTSSWVEWCKDEDELTFIADTHWFLLTPKADSRIYTIDTLADLEWLVDRYPLDLRGTGLEMMRDRYLDYVRIAQEYDAIHLTEEGQWRTRLTFPNLYGWDVESTVWFRWCFAKIREIEPTVVANIY